MAVWILIVYGHLGNAMVGAFDNGDMCWLMAHNAEQVGVTADCRMETFPSKLAPVSSPRPLPRPQK